MEGLELQKRAPALSPLCGISVSERGLVLGHFPAERRLSPWLLPRESRLRSLLAAL